MVSGTSEPGNAVARRRPRWRRPVAWLAAAVLVLVVGAVVYRLVRRPGPEPPVVDLTSADPQVARAVTAARADVLRAPRSGQAWGHLGMVLVTHNFQEEGIRCLTEAERLDPQELRWPYFRGVLLANRDPAVGVPELRRAVELAPAETEAPRLRLAITLLRQGQWDEAEGLFAQVLAQDADNPRALLGLGRVARKQDRLHDSAAYLRRCADSPFTRHSARSLLAEIYERQGDHPAAERELRLVDGLPADAAWPDPIYKELEDVRVGVQAEVTRAMGLVQEGRSREALDLLEPTVREYPDVDYAWLAYGMTLLSARDFATAEGAFRKALRISPNMADAHFDLGLVLFEQKKYAEAADSFRRAAELQPADARSPYNLGQCLKEMGKRPEAAKAFRAALRARPQFAEAHRDLGELLAEGGNDAEALEHLREAVKLAPGDTAAQQLLDKVQKKSRKPAQP
jgi:tetratricopeptide (TPR) repeat protein